MEVYFKDLSFRLLRDKIFKNEARADFVTSWRPQTTFGYKNDFDFAQYQKSLRKRMSSLYSNSYIDKKLYAFDSHPQPQIMIKYFYWSELNFSLARKWIIAVEQRKFLTLE